MTFSRFSKSKSPPRNALAPALAFTLGCAFACPCSRAALPASTPGTPIAGTRGGGPYTLPEFLRNNDLNTAPLVAPPAAAGAFFSATGAISAPLNAPALAGRDITGGVTGTGATPSIFSFLPGTPDSPRASDDARNAQVMLAELVQSSTIAPHFHPGPGARARPLADTATADTELRAIVARQNEIFANADAAGDSLHPDDLQSQLQQLTQRYDKLLRVYPNYVAGLVAYGQLLNIIGMAKEGAALMSVANNLDGAIPLVKNELGNYCAEEGHPLIALVFYTAAIQLAPREPFYYYQLGTLLTEARDIFLTDAPGMWTRDKIDEAMQAAFRYAMDLAPGNWLYAYRYGLSYYDLGLKEWEDALQFWQAFEKKLNPGFEQEVARLHQAKILIALRRPGDAQKLLGTVTHPLLATQRDTVAAALNACKDIIAHPNPNVEITTGSADDQGTQGSQSQK